MLTETQPWLVPWNFDALRFLFRFLPHTLFGIRLASFLLENPLFATWLYAAVSYVYWLKQDDRTSERRVQLLRVVAAFILAIILSALLDLKIHWPAPTCAAGFQSLFPSWLRNSGVPNSFPSHSTLAYLIVSLGLLRLNKVAGLLLIPLTFLIISLPRVYMGGHYPIDVVGSILISLVALAVIDALLAKDRVSKAFSWAATRGQYSEVAFFLWLYELADGFHSAENTAHFAFRLVRSL